MAQIQLDNINKYYGGLHVVKDFNLSIADEEFVVFVGPSGCGKSTTLRMVAGTRGSIVGSDFNRRPRRK